MNNGGAPQASVQGQAAAGMAPSHGSAFMYPGQGMMYYPGMPGFYPGAPGVPTSVAPHLAFPGMPYGLQQQAASTSRSGTAPAASSQGSAPSSNQANPSTSTATAAQGMSNAAIPMAPYGYHPQHFMQFPGMFPHAMPGSVARSVPNAPVPGTSPTPPGAQGAAAQVQGTVIGASPQKANQQGVAGVARHPGAPVQVPGMLFPGGLPPAGYAFDPRMMAMMGQVPGASLPGMVHPQVQQKSPPPPGAQGTAALPQPPVHPQPSGETAAAAAGSAPVQSAAAAAGSQKSSEVKPAAAAPASAMPRDFSAPLSLSLFGEEDDASATPPAETVPPPLANGAITQPQAQPAPHPASSTEDDDEFGSFEGPTTAAAPSPAVATGNLTGEGQPASSVPAPITPASGLATQGQGPAQAVAGQQQQQFPQFFHPAMFPGMPVPGAHIPGQPQPQQMFSPGVHMFAFNQQLHGNAAAAAPAPAPPAAVAGAAPSAESSGSSAGATVSAAPVAASTNSAAQSAQAAADPIEEDDEWGSFSEMPKPAAAAPQAVGAARSATTGKVASSSGPEAMDTAKDLGPSMVTEPTGVASAPPAPAVASTVTKPAVPGVRMALDEDLFSDLSAVSAPAHLEPQLPALCPAELASTVVTSTKNDEAKAGSALGASSEDEFNDFFSGAGSSTGPSIATQPAASTRPAVTGGSPGDDDDFGDFACQPAAAPAQVLSTGTVPAATAPSDDDDDFGDFAFSAPAPHKVEAAFSSESTGTVKLHQAESPADTLPKGLHIGTLEKTHPRQGGPSAAVVASSAAASSKLVVGTGEDAWGVDWANVDQNACSTKVEEDVGVEREVIQHAAAAAAASASSSKKLVVGTDAYVVGVDWGAGHKSTEEEKTQQNAQDQEKQGQDGFGDDDFGDFSGSSVPQQPAAQKPPVIKDDDPFSAEDDDDFGDFATGVSSFEAVAASYISAQQPQDQKVQQRRSTSAVGGLVVGSGDEAWGISWTGDNNAQGITGLSKDSPVGKYGMALSTDHNAGVTADDTDSLRRTRSNESGGAPKSSLVVGTGEEVWGIKWDQPPPEGNTVDEDDGSDSLKKTRSEGPKSSLMVGSGENVWGINWAAEQQQKEDGGGVGIGISQSRSSEKELPVSSVPGQVAAGHVGPPKGSASGSLMVGSAQNAWGIDLAHKTESDEFGNFSSSAPPPRPSAAAHPAPADDDFGDFSSSTQPVSAQGDAQGSGASSSHAQVGSGAVHAIPFAAFLGPGASAPTQAEGPRQGPLSLDLFGDESEGHLENAQLSLPGMPLPSGQKKETSSKVGPTFGFSLADGSNSAESSKQGGDNLIDLLSQLYQSPPSAPQESSAAPVSVSLGRAVSQENPVPTSVWGLGSLLSTQSELPARLASMDSAGLSHDLPSVLTPKLTVTIVGDAFCQGPVVEKVDALLSAQADVALWEDYAAELEKAQAEPVNEEDLFRDRSGEWVPLVEDLISKGRILDAFQCRNHSVSVALTPWVQAKMDRALDSGNVEEASKWRMVLQILEGSRASGESVVRWREVTRPEWEGDRESVSALSSSGRDNSWGSGMGSRGTSSTSRALHRLSVSEMAARLGLAQGDSRARALLSLFDQDRLVKAAQEDLVSGAAEQRKAEYVFKVLSAAQADRIRSLVQCWYALGKACAEILEGAQQLAEDASNSGVSLEALIGTPQGCHYFCAVAQALGIATSLGATAQLYACWLHAAEPNVGLSLWEHLRKCQESWNQSSPLRQAVKLALPRTDKALAWGDTRGALAMAEMAAMQAAQEFLLPDILARPPLRCAFTLLPLLAFSSVSSVEWSGQRYLSPLANLWANRVSNKSPPVPQTLSA